MEKTVFLPRIESISITPENKEQPNQTDPILKDMARGINPDFLDLSVRPEDDFYLFVNGGWMRNTEIPPDRSSWGSFHELSKSTDEKTLEILAIANADKEMATNKAVDVI